MGFLRSLLLGLLVGAAAQGRAANILFYYSSGDAFGSTATKARAVLIGAGHTVTSVDVGSAGVACPAEIWGNFDQVWDYRYRNTTESCSAPPATWDQFTAVCWQSKAQAYLENCGKMFILVENNAFGGRNLGVYQFLRTIGAVAPGFADCGGASGSDSGPAGTGVASSLPGAPTYFSDFPGGIPVGLLNGTAFATQSSGWSGTNTNRALLAGWDGTQASQLAGLTAPLCQRGRLVTGWDMSNLFFANYDGNAAGKAATDATVAAIATWLGAAACNCGTPTPTPTQTVTLTETPVLTGTPTPTPLDTPSLTATPSVTPSASGTFTATLTPAPANSATASPSQTPLDTATATASFTVSPTLPPTHTPLPTDTETPGPLTLTPKPPSPNPSTDGAWLPYVLSTAADVDIKVYDIAGELVRVLDPVADPAGASEQFWDLKNSSGTKVASGVYLYKIRAVSGRGESKEVWSKCAVAR